MAKKASKSPKLKKTIKKGPARAAAPKVTVSGNAATIAVDVAGRGLEAILGAAYLLTDRAYAELDGDRQSTITVRLTPKSSVVTAKELAAEYLAELGTQEVRWAISRANQPIREFVAEQAVLLANGQGPAPEPAEEPQAEQLSDAQRSEIEKLIAEVEEEIKTMNAKKAVADPKNIKASWEEKQGTPAPKESSA